MNLKYMSAEQLIRTIKSQAAEDALNGHEEFRCTAFGGELLSRIERSERAVKAMEGIVGAGKDSPCTPLWVERIELIIDQWRQGNE